jgi:hypothetical protein
MVQCQMCNKDYNRAEFTQHECLKDMYLKKLNKNKLDVIDFLADHLVLLRRSKEGLGLCTKSECISKFVKSN